MTRRLCLIALWLYPVAFRRRYEQELRALLDQEPTRPHTVLDLLRGALAAHLRPAAATSGFVDCADRVRTSASGVLACWVVFAAAGFGFYKTTEDSSFTAAGRLHPLLGDAHTAIQALAVVASVAVLVGALPLVVLALTQAVRRPGLRHVVSVPVLAVILFAALTGALVALAHSGHSHLPRIVGGIGFIAWGLAGLACGAVCVIGARTALFALSPPRRLLVAAFACGTLVTAAMATMALATTLYAIALPIATPLARTPNGPLQAISTGTSLVVQLAVMVSAASLALVATRRGWGAASQLRASAPN